MDINDFLSAGFETFIRLAELLLAYLKVLAWPGAVLLLALLYKRPLIGVLERLRKATGWGATVELEAEARELAEESTDIAQSEPTLTPISGSHPASPPDEPTTPAPEPSPESEPTTPAPIEATKKRKPRGPVRITRSLTEAQMQDIRDAMRDVAKHQNAATREFNRLVSSRRLSDYTPSIRTEMKNAWLDLELAATAAAEQLSISPNLGYHIPTLVATLVNSGVATPNTLDIAERLFVLHRRLRDQPDTESISLATADDYITTTRNLTQLIRVATEALAPYASRPAARPEEDQEEN